MVSIESKQENKIQEKECDNYPLFDIDEDNPDSLVLICTCGYREKICLKSFLLREDSLKNNHIIKSYEYFDMKNIFKPISQKDMRKFIYSCAILSQIDIISYQEKIKEANRNIKYLTEIKNKYINDLLSQINLIESNYEEFINRNNLLLSFVSSLISNYPSSFIEKDYAISSFLSNISINSNRYKDNNKEKIHSNINQLVDYFKNYRVLYKTEKENLHIKSCSLNLGINNKISHLLLLKDGRIAFCLDNNKTFYIFDLEGKYSNIRGHSSQVNYLLQLSNGVIVSCSNDQSIKFWDISDNSYKCINSIDNAHYDSIKMLCLLSNNRVASCSSDSFIKIWSTEEPYNFLYSLNGHHDTVYSILQLTNIDILISLSKDKSIRKWNTKSYQCESILKLQYDTITLRKKDMLQYKKIKELNNTFVMLIGKYSLSLMNVLTLTINLIIYNDTIDCYNSFILKNGNILCGCKRGILNIYDILTNTVKQFDTKNDELSITSILKISETEFIIGGKKGAMYIWSKKE